jgi:mercuric ion transport protein
MSEETARTAGFSEDAGGAGSGAGLLAVGGILGAIAASSCCVVPLLLFSLGATGAWVGNLSALAAYQPYVIPLTLGFLGAGFYLVYRRPKAVCANETVCARPLSQRLVKVGLWSATVLTGAALIFPFVGPRLLGIE